MVQRGEAMTGKTVAAAVTMAVAVGVASAVAVAVTERTRRRQHGRLWPELLLLYLFTVYETMERRR